MNPWIGFLGFLVDMLTEQVHVPDFQRGAFDRATFPQINYRTITVDTGKTSNKVYHGVRTAASGAVSVLNTNTRAAYGATSAEAKVVLIIQGHSATLTDFEIFQGNADAGTDTLLEDFSSVSLSNLQFMTSKVLTLASCKHLTVRPNAGTISSVTGYIIE